jgi:hypothetical protein
MLYTKLCTLSDKNKSWVMGGTVHLLCIPHSTLCCCVYKYCSLFSLSAVVEKKTKTNGQNNILFKSHEGLSLLLFAFAKQLSYRQIKYEVMS